jgi:hypothetical protein
LKLKLKLKSRPTRTCHAKQWPTPPSVGAMLGAQVGMQEWTT